MAAAAALQRKTCLVCNKQRVNESGLWCGFGCRRAITDLFRDRISKMPDPILQGSHLQESHLCCNPLCQNSCMSAECYCSDSCKQLGDRIEICLLENLKLSKQASEKQQTPAPSALQSPDFSQKRALYQKAHQRYADYVWSQTMASSDAHPKIGLNFQYFLNLLS